MNKYVLSSAAEQKIPGPLPLAETIHRNCGCYAGRKNNQMFAGEGKTLPHANRLQSAKPPISKFKFTSKSLPFFTSFGIGITTAGGN